METIRSFIAIELPENTKKELRQLEDALRGKCPEGCARWVSPDGIHLTLKFLGNVPQDKISAITRAIENASVGFSPFELKVTEIGVFPNERRIQVIWVGVSGELEKLKALQKSIDENLRPLGFEPESRPFTPHLTIARIKESTTTDDRKRLGEIVSATKCELTFPIRVQSVSLMRSQLTPQGAIYHRIASVPLKEK